jgi:chromate transport protein ChrA
MTHTFSGISVNRVLAAGAAAFAASAVLVMLVVFAYAFMLGFQARGQPDQAEIQRFAKAVAPWLGPILASVLAACAAAWVAVRVSGRRLLHGILVGAVVATGVLAIELSQGMGLSDVAKAIPVLGAACLGSLAAARYVR